MMGGVLGAGGGVGVYWGQRSLDAVMLGAMVSYSRPWKENV